MGQLGGEKIDPQGLTPFETLKMPVREKLGNSSRDGLED